MHPVEEDQVRCLWQRMFFHAREVGVTGHREYAGRALQRLPGELGCGIHTDGGPPRELEAAAMAHPDLQVERGGESLMQVGEDAQVVGLATGGFFFCSARRRIDGIEQGTAAKTLLLD